MQKLTAIFITLVLTLQNAAYAAAPAAAVTPGDIAAKIHKTMNNVETAAEAMFKNPFGAVNLQHTTTVAIAADEKIIYNAVFTNKNNDIFIRSLKTELAKPYPIFNKNAVIYLDRTLAATAANRGPVAAFNFIYAQEQFTKRMAAGLLLQGRISFSKLVGRIQSRLMISQERAIALAVNTQLRFARAALEHAINMEVKTLHQYSKHSLFQLFGTVTGTMRKDANKILVQHYDYLKSLLIMRGDSKKMLQFALKKTDYRQVQYFMKNKQASAYTLKALKNRAFMEKTLSKSKLWAPAAAAVVILICALPRDSFTNDKHYQDISGASIKAKAEMQMQFMHIIKYNPELILLTAATSKQATAAMLELLISADNDLPPLSELLPYLSFSNAYINMHQDEDDTLKTYIKDVEYLNGQIMMDMDQDNTLYFLNQLQGFKPNADIMNKNKIMPPLMLQEN